MSQYVTVILRRAWGIECTQHVNNYYLYVWAVLRWTVVFQMNGASIFICLKIYLPEHLCGVVRRAESGVEVLA